MQEQLTVIMVQTRSVFGKYLTLRVEEKTVIAVTICVPFILRICTMLISMQMVVRTVMK